MFLIVSRKSSPQIKIEETTSNLDWYPTLLAITDTPLPKEKVVRGKNILPLLKGEKISDWDNSFYAEYSMINYRTAYMRAYRTPEWKLVIDFKDSLRNELYHLEEDPEERHNLYKVQEAVIENQKRVLREKIIRQMRKLNDPLLKGIDIE